MVRYAVCSAALLEAVAWATADDKPTPPKKASRLPDVSVLAQATETDGRVFVRFSVPVEVPDGADPAGGPERAPVIGAQRKMGWYDVERWPTPKLSGH